MTGRVVTDQQFQYAYERVSRAGAKTGHEARGDGADISDAKGPCREKSVSEKKQGQASHA